MNAPAKDRKDTQYDAFISYSTADRDFAAALEKAWSLTNLHQA